MRFCLNYQPDSKGYNFPFFSVSVSDGSWSLNMPFLVLPASLPFLPTTKLGAIMWQIYLFVFSSPILLLWVMAEIYSFPDLWCLFVLNSNKIVLRVKNF